MTRGLISILLGGLLLTGLFAWGDALIAGAGALPPVPWGETAGLAARSAGFLAPGILAGLALVLLAGGRKDGRLLAVCLPVAAFWVVFFLVMSRGSWRDKWWWKAALWALLASWVLRRIARLRPARLPSDPGDGPRRRPGLIVAVLLLLWMPMAILPAVLDEGEKAGGPEAPPGVLLIVIDTLRADHMGAYGYERPTSPVLDSLAGRGILFKEVVSPSSWTLPAMASILTSTYPGRHGADRLGTSLPRDMDDLASSFRAAGYRTASFNTNPWLRRSFGFDDGFDDYYDQARVGLSRNLAGIRLKNLVLRVLDRIRDDPERVPGAGEVTGRAISWLRRNGDRPFFLYLHYMDVHAPYLPEEPFRDAFCRGHDLPWPDHTLEYLFRRKKIKPEPEILEHVIERYDESILAADSSIGELVEEMARLGLLDGTHLVVTSDHGEEFYDHGGTRHSRTLYQEVVRVPLIWVPPGSSEGGGRVIERRVSTLDLYPSLLAAAGLRIPEGLAGEMLPLQDRAPDARLPRAIGSQLWYKERPWTALFIGGDKIVRTGTGQEARVELFDLDRDPAERKDLSISDPNRVEGLLELMNRYESAWGSARAERGDEETVDPEILEELKALGYVE